MALAINRQRGLNICTLVLVIVLCQIARGQVEEVEEFDEEETRTTSTIEKRSGLQQQQQVVTGTFRFRRVVNGGDVGSNEQSSRVRANGWDVSGCYCRDGPACTCSGNPSRVRMFVRSPASSRKPTRRPSDSDDDNEGEDEDYAEDDGQSGRQRGRQRGRNRQSSRLANGCFCTASGCEGTMCTQLNGCVCNSTGSCWGSACAARISTAPQVQMPMSTQLTMPMTTQLNAMMGAVNRVPMAQMVNTGLAGLTINGQPAASQIANTMTPSAALAGNCQCSTSGCTGTGCSQLNGCFCIGNSCWGGQCRSPIMQQPTNNLMTSALSGTGLGAQIQLGATNALGNLQTGLQSALGGLGSLGGMGGLGGLGGGLGGLGGAVPFNGQMIPVVKGFPIQRIRGNQARGLLRQHSNGARMVAVPAGGRMRRKIPRHGGRMRNQRHRSSGAGVQFSGGETSSSRAPFLPNPVTLSVDGNKLTGENQAVSMNGFTRPMTNVRINSMAGSGSNVNSQALPLPQLLAEQLIESQVSMSTTTVEPPSKLGAIQKSFQESVAKLFKKSFKRRKGTMDETDSIDEDEEEFVDDDDGDGEESEASEVKEPIYGVDHGHRDSGNSNDIQFWTDWSNKIIDVQL